MEFTGERIVPGADNCEPTFAQKMYQEHIARYAFAAQFVQDCDVLDVACGVGYGAQWLAKSGAKSVVGIDIAEDAIEHAKRNYFHPSVKFRVKDATSMEFDGEFDVVTCFEFIEHVDEQSDVLDAIKRSLKPNGILIISTPRPLNDKRTDFHVHELEFEELRRMLAERFPCVEGYFERNCFASFVGSSMPDVLENITKITDLLQIEHADYFIFIAQANKTLEIDARPVLAVNDDSYVLRLEQDIVNLRNGENYHNQLINDLSEKSQRISSELEAAQTDLSSCREQALGVTSIQKAILEINADVAALHQEAQSKATIAAVQAELEAVRHSRDELAQESERTQNELLRQNERLIAEAATVASVQAELEAARHSLDELAQESERTQNELLRQNERLIAENGRIRTVLSKVAQKLAETETCLTSKEGELDLLIKELTKMNEAHAREMQVLNLKYEECERTLARFRQSVSWSVTRPIRWTGRQYRKLVRRSVP